MIAYYIPSFYSGGSVVHSEGRLIPHEFPITDLQQIFATSRNGIITCTVSSERATFNSTTGTLQARGVTQSPGGTMANLIVYRASIDTFKNGNMYCTDIKTNHFYLYFMSSNSESFYQCFSLNHKNIAIIRLPVKFI